jgi:hypothetical protein
VPLAAIKGGMTLSELAQLRRRNFKTRATDAMIDRAHDLPITSRLRR